MRGFEPFRLASTSVPIMIGMGRSGAAENFFDVSGFSGHGEKSQRISKFHIISARLYGFRLVTTR